MAPQPKVLFVLTSHDKMGDTGKPTGWYLPEFAHPYTVLSPHVQITIASPLGGSAPLDPSSITASQDDPISTSFHLNQSALWNETVPLSSVSAHDYAAIFFVGGHGPMWDLATDPVSHALINEFYSGNKIVSAVCHGPAALTHVKLTSTGAGDGADTYLLDGQRVTGFSNEEEEQAGLTAAMPFSLEDKLNEASGGKYEKAGKPWEKKVVVARGGRLITGQNPASAEGVGQAIYDAIFGELTSRDEI